MDLGPPIAYEALPEGTPVYAAGGEPIGTVGRVLAVEEKDIFDGIIVATDEGERFVDAEQVAAIHERGVSLSLQADEAARLSEPQPNPAVIEADPELTAGDRLKGAAKGAWDRLSGNY
ncbi:MAG: hypothetical protein M3133_07670 [Actinomycetota bacterium]|nr:hypothetical protein [Actinomycetota bacterium]